MATKPNVRILSFLHLYVKTVSIFSMILGFAVLSGWLLDYAVLKSVLPGLLTMKPNTAVSFVIIGFALWLGQHETTNSLRFRFMQACAGFVLLLGLLSLMEYALKPDLHIDQFLFKGPDTPLTSFPGWMSFMTALNFTLISSALLLINVDGEQGFHPSQYLILVAAGNALVALFGYAYDLQSLYGFGGYSSMALYSAITFVLLAAAVLAVRPDQGWMKIVVSETIQGVVVRRLLPLAIGLPILIGWFGLLGQRLGLYDTDFGLALIVILRIAALTVIVWLNAKWLNRVDAERQRTAAVLKGSEDRFQRIVEAAPSAMISVDHKGLINLINIQAQKLFGYEPTELLGHPIETLVPKPLRTEHIHDRQGFLRGPTSRAMGVGRELFGLHKDGHEIPVEIGLSSYEGTDGFSTLALIVDIRERKAAQAQNIFHARLLRHINDAVIATDAKFHITAWNRAAERMYGWMAEETLGLDAAEIMGSSLTEEQRVQAIERLKEGSTSRNEIIHHRKDGQAIYVESDTIALMDDYGKLTGYVSVNRDITERKQVEEKLQRQNQRLKVLREIDTAILASDSMENIVGVALSHIRELIHCERANLALIEWEKNEAVNFDVRDIQASAISKGARVSLALIQDVLQVLSRNQPVIMDDLTTLSDPLPQVKIFIQEGLRSRCILPLFSQGSLIGSFTLSSKIPGYFDEEKISLGREVANQVAIAITQSNLINTLREFNAELEQRVAERTRELSEANLLLKAMLDYIPDQIYFKDLQSRFIRNSRSQAKLMGLNDSSEVIGKSDFDFFLHAQRSFDEEQELMRSEQPIINLEEYVAWPNGHATWVSTTKVPLRDLEGKIVGILGISRDITERKLFEQDIQNLNNELKQQAEQLQESEEKFSKAFLASPAAMSIARASDGRYIDVNEALARMTGYSREELLGHTSVELGLVDSAARAKILQAGKEIGFVRDTEIQVQTRSKHILDVLVSLEQIALNGEICMLTIQYDITERKRAEDKIQRLNQELESNRKDIQRILDSMATLNAKVALDGTLLFVNKIATQALGLSVAVSMKTNFLEGQWWAFDSRVQARVKEAFDRACSGIAVSYDEKVFVFGQVLTISFSLTPMLGNDGSVEYILAEGRDISKLKDAEEALRLKTVQLEAANQELESFSYSVSHDLRAPLRAINGFSQALSNKYADSLDEPGRHYLDRIQQNTHHMGQLIDDLLSLSRISRREMKHDAVNLTELARTVDQELRAQEPERQVVFEAEERLEANGDAGLIRIVLQNLLTNSWKFTSSRSAAHIQFGILPHFPAEGAREKIVNETSVFFVRDNGVGFDMAYANKLFGAFQRLHSTAEFPGTGIGLATVQRIIHRHGGKIWAEAELGHGATFYFTLGGSHES